MSWVGPRLAAIAERGYDAAWLRSMLVEVNDGIIVTAGVVEGLAGAGATAKTILIAGFSAVVGGGIALGGAKYGEEDDPDPPCIGGQRDGQHRHEGSPPEGEPGRDAADDWGRQWGSENQPVLGFEVGCQRVPLGERLRDLVGQPG